MKLENYKLYHFRQHWQKLFGYYILVFISIFLVCLDFLHPISVHGFITEQNNYISLTTRDSGTFVGTKEVLNFTTDSNQAPGDGKGKKGSIPKPQFGIDDKIYYAFRGIPYAKPPVGRLLWKPPELMDIKSGPIGATKFRAVCSQWNANEGRVIGSLDCLYLNIFTPRLHFNTGTTEVANYSKYDDDPRTTVRLLPVMIYVHDGDFTTKSGNFNGHERFMKDKVLLVTFNYRLGIFGFLSTGSKMLPGNYGLMDQIFALKWIKKNIHRFGGDPSRMTIFGEISFLLLSPLAQDLFSNAILMSSTTSLFTPGFIKQKPLEYFESVVSEVECPDFKTEGDERLSDILNDCLNIKSEEELIKVQHELLHFSNYPKGIGPVIDGAYQEYGILPLPVEELLGSCNFTNTPIMIGVSQLEGFGLFQDFYKKALRGVELENLERTTKRELRRDLSQIKTSLTEGSFEGVWKYYFGGVDFTQESAFRLVYLQLIHLFGDVAIYNGQRKVLEFLASKKEAVIFNYVFDYNVQKWNSIMESKHNVSTLYPWEEEYYLFSPLSSKSSDEDYGEDSNSTASKQDDSAMSEAMIRVWTSFASYGTPKKAVSFRNWTRWTKFAQTNLNQTNYYHIRLDSSHMESDFRKKEYKFWLDALPKLGEMAIEVESMEDWPVLFWVALGVTIFLVVFIAFIVYFIRK